jgi:hypothetical protein
MLMHPSISSKCTVNSSKRPHRPAIQCSNSSSSTLMAMVRRSKVATRCMEEAWQKSKETIAAKRSSLLALTLYVAIARLS